MQKTNLVVTNFQTASLITYEKNTKIHNDKQIKQIMESINEFNFTNPILIDENNVILAGHGRFFAAQKLKLKEVPVIKLDYLSEAQKKAYRIADNKLTENGNWDYDLLKLELCELEKLNLDFSLDITGFETAEIDMILDCECGEKEKKINKRLNYIITRAHITQPNERDAPKSHNGNLFRAYLTTMQICSKTELCAA